MIESYRSGRMKINSVTYNSDLLVFPDQVTANWWRIEGHKLHVEGLEEVFYAKPEILVMGTGCYGLMKVLPETKNRLVAEKIRLIVEKTGKAYQTFNNLSKLHRVVGAFHLTC